MGMSDRCRYCCATISCSVPKHSSGREGQRLTHVPIGNLSKHTGFTKMESFLWCAVALSGENRDFCVSPGEVMLNLSFCI